MWPKNITATDNRETAMQQNAINSNNNNNNNSNANNDKVIDNDDGQNGTEANEMDTRLTGGGCIAPNNDPPSLVAESTDSLNNGSVARSTLNDLVADLCISSGNIQFSNRMGDYTNIRATADRYTTTMQAQSSNTSSSSGAPSSSFSFKHFLNSSSTITAPSTTVTSLDVVTTSHTATTTITVTNAMTTNPLQTSTGARPKVPQSASGSLMQSECSSVASKMKRSPRFSSFDSQASLAEYAGSVTSSRGNDSTVVAGACGTAVDEDDDDDDTSAAASNVRRNRMYDERQQYNSGTTISSRDVHRSYSSYDMPPAPTCSATRRRSGISGASGNRDARPNRLAFGKMNSNSAKMKLDLPLDTLDTLAVASNNTNTNRTLPNHQNVGAEYAPAAAAALPDFVQDHWLDSLCAHDMHLNSPPNSPICEFIENEAAMGGATTAGSIGLPCAGTVAGNVNSGNASDGTATKMLPDFLSDGPIIHSSQRLADVAAGLPSNSIGSPQDSSTTNIQLSTLRQENERLLHQLMEVRTELGIQMRRANELARQVQQDMTRRHQEQPATLQKLRQELNLLKAEIAALRCENEALRETGAAAVGGTTTATSATATSPKTTTKHSDYSATNLATDDTTPGGSNTLPRPSRTQQLSRELFRAAANAETNLRHLLAGVDNLRQMAASLSGTTTSNADYNISPDLYADFHEDDEDFVQCNESATSSGST